MWKWYVSWVKRQGIQCQWSPVIHRPQKVLVTVAKIASTRLMLLPPKSNNLS
jgi:hypothetical protein